MKLGISHHFYNKENRALARLSRDGEKSSNEWAFGAFKTVELTTEGIQRHLLSGKAISVAACSSDWRKEANFISSQLYGLDFDNDVSVRDCLRDPFLEEYAFLTYATPSSTPAKPRSRVLFALDDPITDVDTYKRFWKRLALFTKISNADEQCKDAVRIFYGSHTDDYSAWLEALLPISLLEGLPLHPDELPKPEVVVQREVINVADPQQRERLTQYGSKSRENILLTLRTTPEGMDIRHAAINAASMKLAAFSKGGWDEYGVRGWEDEYRSVLRSWGRAVQEIESSIKGAYQKALPFPLSLPERDTRVQHHLVAPSKPAEISEVHWRDSDESMARYRERLQGGVDLDTTPLIFPLKCLHYKGGFCLALRPGVMVGIVGLSGGLKTALLETITELWRQMDAIDILWWGIEWSWENMADRAIQRMGSLEKPTPTVGQMMLHEIWMGEAAQGKPEHQRYGRRLSNALQTNAEWASLQIESWLGKCHYVEEVDLEIDTLLERMRQKVKAARENGRNIRVVVFDYVQLLNMRGIHAEDERITTALGRIKAFCIEQKLIGICASQVTKSSAFAAKKGDDVLEAESGQNFRGDKFNLVLTLNPVYNGKLVTNKAVINVSKNSAGATGAVKTYIDPARYKWLDSVVSEEAEKSKIEDADFENPES